MIITTFFNQFITRDFKERNFKTHASGYDEIDSQQGGERDMRTIPDEGIIPDRAI